MKSFSFYRPLAGTKRPQEDYFLFKDGAAVVADGVTLEVKPGESYPSVSGTGEAARLFCEDVMNALVAKGDDITGSSLVEIFTGANCTVQEFNAAQGRTKERINYSDFDYFGATSALGIVHDETLLWWSICDAGVAVLDAGGAVRFHSPSAWGEERREKYLEPMAAEHGLPPGSERRAWVRHTFRNGINDKNELIGYGLVTGEEAAVRYLNYGALELAAGDTALIYTDGFEPYLELDRFKKLFAEWPERMEDQLDALTQELPEKYSEERTLVAFHI